MPKCSDGHAAKHEGETFVCPLCNWRTRHPDDVADGYCAKCKWQTGDAFMRQLMPFYRFDRWMYLTNPK